MGNRAKKSNADDHSMDAVKYLQGVGIGNARCEVRKAILDRFELQPDVLKREWRRKCTELTRRYQRQRCLTYEHAEAEAFEDVLCALWLGGEKC